MNLNLSFKLHPVECRQYPGLSKLICLHPSDSCWLTQLPYYLLTLPAAPLPPAPASGGAGGLTDTGDGAQYYLLSPVKREEFSCFYVLALMAASL